MAESSPNNSTQTTPESNDGGIFGTKSSLQSAAPTLSIKLDDKNFLLWNQQVEGVITAHKLHRLLVNPTIPQKYDSDADRQSNHVSDAYDKWLVQDQTLFTWLLSTFSDSVLPRVLGCRHSWQVWDKIHNHYYSHLKAKTRQLRSELKNTKKGSRTISEFVLRIHALADSLTAIGETIADQDLIDIVIDGLPEEYNQFVMMLLARLVVLDRQTLRNLLCYKYHLCIQ